MFRGDCLRGEIESADVAQQDAQGVAEAAVGFRHLLEEVFPEGDFILPVHGGGPQAHDVCAVFVVVIGRVNGFAALGVGFGGFFPGVLVHDEAVGHYGLVRSLAAPGDGKHQGTLEPAAVLVRSFQVKVRRRVQPGAVVHDGHMGTAGINPDVQRILALFPGLRQAEAFAQVFIGEFKPDVGTVFLHHIRDFANQSGVQDGFAVFVKEDGQRHAPGALAGDAPVRPGFHRAVNAVAAPGGQPLHLVYFFQGLRAELVHGDEELFHGPENYRRLGTPAVRVLVAVFFHAEEVVALFQHGNDVLVGVKDMFAHQGGHAHFLRVFAVVVHGGEDGQSVLASHVIVVRAVAGRDVDDAGSGVRGDKVRQDDC